MRCAYRRTFVLIYIHIHTQNTCAYGNAKWHMHVIINVIRDIKQIINYYRRLMRLTDMSCDDVKTVYE